MDPSPLKEIKICEENIKRFLDDKGCNIAKNTLAHGTNVISNNANVSDDLSTILAL